MSLFGDILTRLFFPIPKKEEPHGDEFQPDYAVVEELYLTPGVEVELQIIEGQGEGQEEQASTGNEGEERGKPDEVPGELGGAE